jgi:hypothetical protein
LVKPIGKCCAAVLAVCVAALPLAANAQCVSRDDLHAMQASSLQQRLMVSAFQCHDVDEYNHFVLGHQPELQKFDAALLAFFRRGDPNGMVTYNAYKTHLANISALEQAHSYTFCDDVAVMYRRAAGTPSLEPLLDTLPLSDTAYATCEAPNPNASVVASNPATDIPEPPVVAPPAPVVVASVTPLPPVTQPTAPVMQPTAPVTDTAPPQDTSSTKHLTAPGRAVKWFGGLLRNVTTNVTSLVGMGGSDESTSPPAGSDATPSMTSAEPTSSNSMGQNASITDGTPAVAQPAASAGSSLASSDVSPAWDPNQPLITTDQDQASSASLRGGKGKHRHRKRAEDDPLYGEDDYSTGNNNYDDGR